jgi:hypothetical protein
MKPQPGSRGAPGSADAAAEASQHVAAAAAAGEGPVGNGTVRGGEDGHSEPEAQPASDGSAAEPAGAGAAPAEGGGEDFLQGPQILAFRELLAAEAGGPGAEKLEEEEEETEQLAQLMTSFAGDGGLGTRTGDSFCRWRGSGDRGLVLCDFFDRVP